MPLKTMVHNKVMPKPGSRQTKKPVAKKIPVPKRTKKYVPSEQMLDLIVNKTKIDFNFFNSFSKLNPNQTIKLWNRQKEKKSPARAVNPLIELWAANKIVIEKNKTLKQIAKEMSVQLNNASSGKMSVSETGVQNINAFLGLRKKETLNNAGKLAGKLSGGARDNSLHQHDTQILELYLTRDYSNTQIAKMLGISNQTIGKRIQILLEEYYRKNSK